MAERFDAVVVGAGPAGSAAALAVARGKFAVLLVERGRAPGAKNMFGGRIYAWPLFEILPEWAKDCPVERFVTRESIVFLSGEASLGMQFENPASTEGRASSFTALRPRFDEWLSKKAEAAGAMLITGIRVDELLREGGRVRGVVAGPDRITADVVILAEGAMAPLAQKAGLLPPLTPSEVSVGVKETVELPAATIQERFNVGAGDAAGFLINNGYTFRGVDLAIASGIAGARAAVDARGRGDFSAAGLASYERHLRTLNVLTDLEKFRATGGYLKNERLFSLYPRLLLGITEKVFTVDGSGKEKISRVVLEEMKGKAPLLKMLKDLLDGARSM